MISVRFIRFNGAGVLRPRKCLWSKWTRGFKPRFNGAGVLRPRKSAIRACEYLGILPLQWGRGFKTPEMPVEQVDAGLQAPLQWGRGFKTPEIVMPPA